MKDKKKQLLLSIGLVLILVLMIVGISYAAFKFTGLGNKPNTITTGAITMEYTETTNTISMNNALPTTDATGKVRLTAGEYFDFTLSGTIKGSENINWEIAAEDVTTASRKIDGKYIKLYLTSLDENNNEKEVMAPTVYSTDTTENTYTGRPANMMSLAKGTTSTSFSTKYRLRMYVDESYNPQGDGGNLAFSIKINAYGKTGDKMPEPTAAEVLIAKANAEDLDYDTATNDQKKEMWTFTHEATEQTTALTDYRYIGKDPNNYVKFNDELWRIIGVFDTDDGTGKVEKRLKIIRNESIGYYSWDNKDKTTGAESTYGKNEWTDARLNYLLNPGHESETTGGSLYWNRGAGNCYNGQNNATKACDFTTTGLTEKAKSMIGDAKWYLGGSSTDDDVTAPMFYTRERGTGVYSGRSTSWTGKVGLMYPSDYGYATSGGATTNRASCLAKELFNWDWYDSTVSDCENNDWLYNSSILQWTITPRQAHGSDVFFVSDSGSVKNYIASTDYGVWPVVHLNSAIKVITGSGTKESPYILE